MSDKIYRREMSNIVCYYCSQIGHRISECVSMDSEGMHSFILQKLVNYKLRNLYRTFEEINTDDLRVLKQFSSSQMKVLLGITSRRYIFKRKLYDKMYKKYDRMSNEIVTQHVDYPNLLRHSVRRDEILVEDARMIDNMERELSRQISHIRQLHSRRLREYLLDLPEQMSQFIQSQNISLLPVFESRSPPYSPPQTPRAGIRNEYMSKIELVLSEILPDAPFDCPVCQDCMESMWKVRFNCLHDFCIGCTIGYLSNVSRSPVCPLCRAEITKMELYNAYTYNAIFCK